MEVTNRSTSPPAIPRIHVAIAKVNIPRRGITFAKPQNVIGPPAAAVNSRAPAGAVPIPANNMAATSGISNIKGTLIAIPTDAATTIPTTSSPIQVVMVWGLIH